MDPEIASLVSHPAFRSFAQHLPCVLYIGRPDWPPVLEFISSNVERLIGYRDEEFLAKPGLFLEFIHPEDRARVADEIRLAMMRPVPYRLEFRVVHRNGKDVLSAAMLSVPVPDAAGRVVRRQGIIVDVTEQKRLEAELLASQRLAVIGEMAAMMAHEIRNPLAGMELALRVLRGLVAANPEARECVEDLAECAARIRDAVSLAEDLAAVRPVMMRACHLASVVSGACRRTAPYVRKRRVRVDAEVPPDLPALVADAAQLEQAFVNLILHAARAMPEGGRLAIRARVEAECLAVEIVAAPSYTLSEESLSSAPAAQGCAPDGLALGVSLCQRILAAHGASLRVEGAPGKGPVFHLKLPLDSAHAPRAAD